MEPTRSSQVGLQCAVFELSPDLLCSIEDPFETWYDVAHVIKSQQMAYIRKEFLRAYTLASRIASQPKPVPAGQGDALPETVSPAQFLSILCETADEPPFSAAYKERVERLQF